MRFVALHLVILVRANDSRARGNMENNTGDWVFYAAILLFYKCVAVLEMPHTNIRNACGGDVSENLYMKSASSLNYLKAFSSVVDRPESVAAL